MNAPFTHSDRVHLTADEELIGSNIEGLAHFLADLQTMKVGDGELVVMSRGMRDHLVNRALELVAYIEKKRATKSPGKRDLLNLIAELASHQNRVPIVPTSAFREHIDDVKAWAYQLTGEFERYLIRFLMTTLPVPPDRETLEQMFTDALHDSDAFAQSYRWCEDCAEHRTDTVAEQEFSFQRGAAE